LQATIPAPVTMGSWVRVEGSNGRPGSMSNTENATCTHARACGMKIMSVENLRKKAEKFRQWKEDECLQVPNEACFDARNS
jgi:hypothetical protein